MDHSRHDALLWRRIPGSSHGSPHCSTRNGMLRKTSRENIVPVWGNVSLFQAFGQLDRERWRSPHVHMPCERRDEVALGQFGQRSLRQRFCPEKAQTCEKNSLINSRGIWEEFDRIMVSPITAFSICRHCTEHSPSTISIRTSSHFFFVYYYMTPGTSTYES
jgi:hypothetical protein